MDREISSTEINFILNSQILLISDFGLSMLIPLGIAYAAVPTGDRNLALVGHRTGLMITEVQYFAWY